MLAVYCIPGNAETQQAAAILSRVPVAEKASCELLCYAWFGFFSAEEVVDADTGIQNQP